MKHKKAKPLCVCRAPVSWACTYIRDGEEVPSNDHNLAGLAAKFGKDYNDFKKEGVKLLFVADNHSCSGELAETFVMFSDASGGVFEVWGSECSVWNFTAQWEPEGVVMEAWTRSLCEKYAMGREHGTGEDLWGEKFIQTLDSLFEFFDERTKAVLKRKMPRVLAHFEKQMILNEIPSDEKQKLLKPKIM